MKVRVKLYGTLGRHVAGYVHAEGLVIEIPDKGKVGDLLSALGMAELQGVAVAMGGRILSLDDELHDNDLTDVIQALHGG